jgi:hypothetical protein
MVKYSHISGLLQQVFDNPKLVQKASQIVCALLEAGSPRLSRIADKMPGQPASNYKAIQRFLKQVDLMAVLKRFFQEQAEFVIADPTEMPRPHAKHTQGASMTDWVLAVDVGTPFQTVRCPFIPLPILASHLPTGHP